MRPEFPNITEQSFFLASSSDIKKEEPLSLEQTGKFNVSHVIKSIPQKLSSQQTVTVTAEKFTDTDSINASRMLKESTKMTVPSHQNPEEEQTTIISRSEAASSDSSIINEFSGAEILSAKSSPSPREVRYKKMLTDAHAAEMDAEYQKLCEHWKGIVSTLENKGYYNVISNLLERLVELLSSQSDSSLEEGLAEQNKALSDFVKLNKTTYQHVFDQKLRAKYQQAHAEFQKALQQYLVCKVIVEVRLLCASPKEEALLIDVLEKKQRTVDQTMRSLEEIKQTILEDNEQKSIESLRKAYPEAATLEEARQKWMNDLPAGE